MSQWCRFCHATLLLCCRHCRKIGLGGKLRSRPTACLQHSSTSTPLSGVTSAEMFVACWPMLCQAPTPSTADIFPNSSRDIQVDMTC